MYTEVYIVQPRMMVHITVLVNQQVRYCYPVP